MVKWSAPSAEPFGMLDGEGQATLQGNRRTGSSPEVCSVGTVFMARFDEWPDAPDVTASISTELGYWALFIPNGPF
jgi:hypothetical protein